MPSHTQPSLEVPPAQPQQGQRHSPGWHGGHGALPWDRGPGWDMSTGALCQTQGPWHDNYCCVLAVKYSGGH